MRRIAIFISLLYAIGFSSCKKCVKCYYEYTWTQQGQENYGTSYDDVFCGNKKKRAVFEDDWQKEADKFKADFGAAPTIKNLEVTLMCFPE